VPPKKSPKPDPRTLAEAARVCACFNFRKASRAVTQLFDNTLQPGGLRSTQFVILVAVSVEGTARLPELARRAEATRLLGDPRFELDAGAPQRVHAALLALIERDAASFGARAARIVEAHGDLRPEHICLNSPPVIYDRLEFNRAFRLLDPAEELSYLAMECELLGAPAVGARVFEVYVAHSGDDPPASVRHGYMAYRACLRARLAARHILDRPREDWGRWLAEARRYLDAAERHCQAVNPPTAR